MFKFAIGVFSQTLTVDEMSEIIGIAPTSRVDKGVARKGTRIAPRWSIWKLEPFVPSDVHIGLEGMSDAIAGLDLSLAQKLSVFGEMDASVALSLVQYVYRDSEWRAQGISLDARAINWLATAKASFGVDQYFLPDEDDPDGPPPLTVFSDAEE